MQRTEEKVKSKMRCRYMCDDRVKRNGDGEVVRMRNVLDGNEWEKNKNVTTAIIQTKWAESWYIARNEHSADWTIAF